jgi:hypothetical protein
MAPNWLDAAPIVVALPQGVVVRPGTGAAIIGLTPGLASSVAPSGIVLVVPAPGTPSPEAGVFAMPGEVPVALVPQLVPIPELEDVPPPSKGPDVPEKALPDIAPVAHCVAPGSGLVPPGSISVAPSGMPTGPDGALKFMLPSGDVAPMPGKGAVCASAPVQPAIARAATQETCRRIVEPSRRHWRGCARHGAADLLEGGHLDLPHALARYPEIARDLLQPLRLVDKAPRNENASLTLVEQRERFRQRRTAIGELPALGQDLLLARRLVDQPVLPAV